MCGVWIGPDLDQPGMTRNEWQLKKIPVIGSLLAWWFTLYSYLVNWEGAGIILKLPVIRWLARNVFCHRGISHWLVIGTLTRVAWLGLPLFILLGLTNRALIVNPVLLGLWMGGLFVSDMLHWLRDYYGLEI